MRIYLQGVPRCAACQKEGPKEWQDMSYTERSTWVWLDRHDPCYCKECYLREKIEKVKYEKEREYYKEYKQQNYPKPSEAGEPRLHRIHSKQEWAGTRSFFASWRAPSTLTQLFQSYGLSINAGNPIETPEQGDTRRGLQRQGTGVVHENTETSGRKGRLNGTRIVEEDEEEEGVEEAQGIGSSSGGGKDSKGRGGNRDPGISLEDLDEEAEMVELESLDSDNFAAMIEKE